jgi:hypothetical protein
MANFSILAMKDVVVVLLCILFYFYFLYLVKYQITPQSTK